MMVRDPIVEQELEELALVQEQVQIQDFQAEVEGKE